MKSVLCVLAWSMPGVAMAMTTAEYLGHCQQASTYDRAVCAGYLDALLEGRLRAETQPGATVAVAAAVASDGAAFEVPVAYRDGYCLPDGATLPQLRDIVVRGLLLTPPPQRQIEARVMITDVLRKAYPPAACDR